MYLIIKELEGIISTINSTTSKEEAEYILAEEILKDSKANYSIEVQTI